MPGASKTRTKKAATRAKASPKAKARARAPKKKAVPPRPKPKARAKSTAKPKAKSTARPKAKSTAKPKRVAKPKAKSVAKPKAKSVAKPKAKSVAKPKAKSVAKPKAKSVAKPKAKSVARTARPRAPAVPAARPSERAVAVASQRPKERSLTDEERDAMIKVAETAARFLTNGAPVTDAVLRIGRFVDDVKSGARAMPKSQDVRLGLGVLWGEQLRARVGWIWVHLTYPDGFASYALVPDDRAFACFPLNRLSELMRSGPVTTNTSVRVFDSICAGALPTRRPSAYLVIG